MLLSGTIKSGLQRLRLWLAGDSLQLMGRMASWQVRSRETLGVLRDAEFKVSSQWGQDGIIDWLVERCNIPPSAQSFVEFGVEDYRQANTRFLLQNRNWRGLILDGSSAMVAAVREDGLGWRHDLMAQPAFITRENINALIAGAGFRGEIGLLSVDLDGNDYWVWEAIEVVRPILCICEYNAVFGDVWPISTPYDPNFIRGKAHHSNLYFGASIAALRLLAMNKGYRFMGTTSSGNDAFFVREDYAKRNLDGAIACVEALPSRLREARDEAGRLSYVGGVDRLKVISAMPVVNVETGETVRLGDLDKVYSDEWLERMTGVVKTGV
jgi:hypothetical protein